MPPLAEVNRGLPALSAVHSLREWTERRKIVYFSESRSTHRPLAERVDYTASATIGRFGSMRTQQIAPSR